MRWTEEWAVETVANAVDMGCTSFDDVIGVDWNSSSLTLTVNDKGDVRRFRFEVTEVSR